MKETITFVICIIAYLVIGFPVLKSAFRNIKRGDIFDEYFLMCVASIGAFCIGEYEEAIMVMILYRIGQFLQTRAVEKSRSSIEELIKSKHAEDNVGSDEALEIAEDATIFRGNTEEYITKIARIYSPVVVVCAVLIAIVPSIVTGEWGRWIHTGLTFLVISCPCAMVISIPIAFYSGIGAASANKILFKGSNYLEALSKVEESAITDVPNKLCGVNIAKG
ncbi:MAG: hypothetical protein MJ150_02590, partial [Clostridia bacterium]|nr:hypothetical protein [Clostridia bacterium]